MKKVVTVIMLSAFYLVGCGDSAEHADDHNHEHGDHEHGENGDHDHGGDHEHSDEDHHQEEFTIENDSTEDHGHEH